jgi:hypothetical protein
VYEVPFCPWHVQSKQSIGTLLSLLGILHVAARGIVDGVC